MRIKFGCNGVGEAANYFVYAAQPVPPGPEPTPEPTPPPVPPPGPEPCATPVASTGYPSKITSSVGSTLLMGRPAVKGVTYKWNAVPAFDGGNYPATAQIKYKPRITKTLTVTATNPCGSKSATTTVIIKTGEEFYQ